MTGGHPNAGPAQPRRPSGGSGRTALRFCAYALAGILLPCAVVLGGARLLLPEIRHYRPEIEGWVGRLAGRNVEIGTIDAYWNGWTPVFRLGDVRLAGGEAPEETQTPSAIRFDALTFSIDPLDSFRSRTLQPRGVIVSGASLTVVRRSDGTFSVRGLGAPPPGTSQPGSPLARWIPSLASLSLHSSQVLWIDEKRRRRPLPLTGVALHLDRDDGRPRVSGSFELPGAGRIDFWTNDVDFRMDGADNPPAPSWSGLVYASAANVDLGLFGLDAPPFGIRWISGRLSGSVWSSWEHARLTEAEGTLRVQSPGITDGADRRRGFDEVGASFKAERTSSGWTLAARDLVIATSNGSWPPSGAGVHWTAPRGGREGAVVVSADFARIEDLAALLPAGGDAPPDPILGALLEAAPRGVLEQLHASAPVAERVDFERASARGRFSGLRFGSEDLPVSVEAAGGEFEANAQGLVVNATTGSLGVDAPRWLAHPLRGEKLTGTFAAVSGPEGVRFRLDEASVATPIGTMTAQGRGLAPRDGSGPVFDVTLDQGASKIAPVRDLLAGGALPEPAARWLEAAAPDGEVRKARLRFHGRPPEPPSGARSLRFEATAELALPVLRHAAGWPELTGVSGTLRFDGSRLEARAGSGRVFGSTLRELRTVIEDVNAAAPVVEISGSVEGGSADAMRYLSGSPLRKRFANVLEDLAPHGRSTIDFGVSLPLGDEGSAAIEGRIALDGNRIGIRGYERGIEAVSGVIAFRNGGVESDGITATLLGEPIRAVLGPSPEQADVTRLSIDGRGTRRLLAAYLHNAGVVDRPLPEDSPLLARLRGGASWNVAIDFPPTGGGAEGFGKWRLTADLTDASLDLPSPFGKADGTERRLVIESRLEPGAERTVDVRYGGLASAVLRLVPDGDGRSRLDRGAIRLGTDGARLPDASGITVRGALPTLDAGAWSALFEDAAALGPADAGAPSLDPLREVSIDAGSFDALGARFPGTRIRTARDADGGWRIDVAGPRLEGGIRIPRDLQAMPVVVDLERLVLEPGPGEPRGERRDEGRSLDPRTLPALSFSARRLVFRGIDLGHAVLRTAPSERGLRIERLATRGDAFEADGGGQWSLADARHRSEFEMQVRGGDLGRMLDSLGLDGSAVAGGATDVSMRGAWAGTPADFALDRLAGVVQFHSAAGRLTRVEPGVTGRVFGLLTLTSLPRRIVLDFGDFFRSGFEYDRIEGTFAIEHGQVHTDDLRMESDTARFEVVGRTGLVSEDYDKIVTVTPKISSALPFLPLWFTQKILGRDVFDQAFSYQYTITGPWDAPAIELVRVPAPEDDGQELR